MANQKQIYPFYQSLSKPILIMGAEREPVIGLGTVSLMVWMAGQDMTAACFALGIWFTGTFICRSMAKHDSHMTKVFIRAVRYQDFYPAREKLNTPEAPKQEKVAILKNHL